ncbi:MAG: diguanylate cyclase [Actinobacteria bacterium]|nr:diguanylate cyclase [Actinomycetota bacterium]
MAGTVLGALTVAPHRRADVLSWVRDTLREVPDGPAGHARLAALLWDLDYESSWQPLEAIVAAREVEDAVVGRGWHDLVTHAQVVRTGAELRRGEMVAAAELARELLARTGEHGQTLVQARLHSSLSTMFRGVGDHAACLDHAVRSMSLTPDDAPGWVRVTNLISLGSALQISGTYEDGEARYFEALALADVLPDRQLSVLVLNNLAYGCYERGLAEAAQEHTDRLVALAEEHRLPLFAEVLDTLARVEMMHGNLTGAQAILEPALADPYGQLFIEPDALPCLLITLAEIQRGLGRPDAAAATLDLCEAVATERGQFQWQALPLRERATLYAETGDFEAAFSQAMAFHDAWVRLHDAERETRARVVHALYEVSESQRARDQFRELATRDPLTGLHNRRHSDAVLPGLVADADGGHPLSLALLDLDHFKRINDGYSHDIGDATLKRTADLLTRFTPPGGAAVRLGGEEFLLVLPATCADDARTHCERLREAFGRHDWTPVREPVSVSIGLVTTTGGTTASVLLSQADRHLYAAKRGGRDRVVG